MSEEPDEIGARSARNAPPDDGGGDGDGDGDDGVVVLLEEKLESVSSDQQDPPLVTATLVPIEPTTIVNDAEAVVNDSTVITHAQLIFDQGGASTPAAATAPTSDYVESTSISVSVPSSISTSASSGMMDPVQSSNLSRQDTSMSASSYTTATEEFLSRQESSATPHEVVQIDAIEDSDRSSSFAVAEQQEKDRFDRMQHYCRIYLAMASLLFISGAIGMVFAFLHFGKLESTNQGLPVLPPTVMAVPTMPSVVLAGPPVTSKPSLSLSPSQTPSCSGNYAQVASVRVAQAGSNFFTMSDKGDTIVVANFHFQLAMYFLETFQSNEKFEVTRSESNEGFNVFDMLLSGDGSRLVLGVSSYPQSDGPNNDVGGALLQLDMIDPDHSGRVAVEWRTRHKVLTQGGFYSVVLNVATSSNGMTVAFVAKSDDGVYIEVYHENSETHELQRLGQRLSQAAFDANTVVELSGSGMRLFVVTNDNKVQVFELAKDGKEWNQLGETIVYDGSAPQVHPSYNGTIVVLGSNFQFPVAVFEERANYIEGAVIGGWHEVGKLDITTSSESQHVALSGDGRNVVVGEKFANEQTVARLFRRSGSGFAQMQDITLPVGNFRGMSLDMGGEQLVAAVEETMTTYRKDCSGGNL